MNSLWKRVSLPTSSEYSLRINKIYISLK
jgi:hypothetical protein